MHAVVPRCLRQARAEREQLERQVTQAYGVVPVDEFDALRARAAVPLDEESLRTFREDYEIGVDGGEGRFFLVYRGGCRVCQLSHRFRHEEQLAL